MIVLTPISPPIPSTCTTLPAAHGQERSRVSAQDGLDSLHECINMIPLLLDEANMLLSYHEYSYCERSETLFRIKNRHPKYVPRWPHFK